MPSRTAMNSGRKIVRNNQHSNNVPQGHPTANNEAASVSEEDAVEQPALGSAPVGQLTVVHDAASQALQETTQDETKITFQGASLNITKEQLQIHFGNLVVEAFEIAIREALGSLAGSAPGSVPGKTWRNLSDGHIDFSNSLVVKL